MHNICSLGLLRVAQPTWKGKSSHGRGKPGLMWGKEDFGGVKLGTRHKLVVWVQQKQALGAARGRKCFAGFPAALGLLAPFKNPKPNPKSQHWDGSS